MVSPVLKLRFLCDLRGFFFAPSAVKSFFRRLEKPLTAKGAKNSR